MLTLDHSITTERIIRWAKRREQRHSSWSARDITEGTGIDRDAVDSVLGALAALGRLEEVEVIYRGRGRPRARRFRLRDADGSAGYLPTACSPPQDTVAADDHQTVPK